MEPLRIAYVCYWDAFKADGVVEKIKNQVAEWRRHQNDVDVFCLSPVPTPGQAQQLEGATFLFDDATTRVVATLRLGKAVRAHRADVVYLRYDAFVPPLLRTLHASVSAVEVNSDNQAEVRLMKGYGPAFAYAGVTCSLTMRSASGLVFVTRELARYSKFRAARKPHVVIANGGDPHRIRSLAAPSNERIRMVFLAGALGMWHGFDKLLWLATHMPDADFELIGPTSAQLPGVTPPNVTAHGLLTHAEYEPILAASDVAIGTLALHRKGMSEASPLKVREYLLHGLPVVLGYEDTDFPEENHWFLLQLPNMESNVRDHLAEIRAFVERSRGKRVPRDFIVERLGAPGKEATRLEFLQRLVGGQDRHLSTSAYSAKAVRECPDMVRDP